VARLRGEPAALPRRRAALGQAAGAKLYALDDGELEAIEDRLAKEGVRPGAWSVGRFKGLGEMNPSSCGKRR